MGAEHPAPVLRTERLILRGFVAEDFARHEEIMAQAPVNRFLGPRLGREDLWRRTVSSVGMWTVCGFGGWMVEHDGRVIGNIGLFDAKRGIPPYWDGQPEMGWIFSEEAHGKGFAGEAGRAVLGWADANLRRDIWAMISPGNEPSFRLAERLGFKILQRSPIGDEGEEIDVLKRTYPR